MCNRINRGVTLIIMPRYSNKRVNMNFVNSPDYAYSIV